MQEPRCKKCGSWLEHEADGPFWVCEACGKRYEYKEPLNHEILALQEMREKLEACANQIADASELFRTILLELSELDRFPLKFGSEIDATTCLYDHGYKSLQEAITKSNALIDVFRRYYTPIGGGEFVDPPEFL